jgi:hypothetical protein
MLALKLNTTRIILINNINVREAIVRAVWRDKNYRQFKATSFYATKQQSDVS